MFAQKTISDKFLQSYEDDGEAIASALRGGISGTAEVVSAYERALCEQFDAKHAIAVSSGGAAVSVALAAFKIGPGDEVIMTPTAPLCTVYPIMAAGATPVFVDTRSDNFGLDLEDLARKTNARTKAIIDIPMWGFPTPVDELQMWCRDQDIPLILDLAHAHGTKLHGRHLSTFGEVSCFSTHERKLVSTGEGGFLLTNCDKIAKRCRDYSRFGNLNGRDFGLNYKLSGLQASLGLSRLKFLDQQIVVRRANAQRLASQLDSPNATPVRILNGGEHNGYSFGLRLTFADNSRFIDHLERAGIPSDIKRYGCRCLYEFPQASRFGGDCKNGAGLLRSFTTIPIHPGVSLEQMDYVASTINEYHEV